MISENRVVTRMQRAASNRLPDVVVDGSILVESLHSNQVLRDVADRLRVRREGGYHGVDVVVFLLLLFAAREQLSIKDFGALTRAHRVQLGALAARTTLPSPASVSRFLAAVESDALREFIPWLLLEGAQALDCLKQPAVMARDCQGQSWHMFDFDPTVTVLRQRSLPEGHDLPEPRRRAHEALRGYPGRKRGDVQLARATLQHAGSSLWLGVWCEPGNGSWRRSSAAAVDTVVRTCAALGHDPRRALIRVDGAAGNTPFVATCEAAGVSYVTRSAHYYLLETADIREHLNDAAWSRVDDSQSGPRRHAAELGRHVLGSRALDENGQPFAPVESRVVVSRFASPDGKSHGVGWFEDGWQYELFLTNVSLDSMPAPEVVSCYYQRTAIENRFHQEDRELGLDRIFSYHIPGQNLACLVGLFAWNLRVCQGLRLMGELPALPPQGERVTEPVADVVVMSATPPEAPAALVVAEVAAEAEPSAREAIRDRVAGLDWDEALRAHDGWTWRSDDKSLRCPTGQVAELAAVVLGDPKRRGHMRFEVAALHCRGCPLRADCTRSATPSFRKTKYFAVSEECAAALHQEWSKPSRTRRARTKPERTRPTSSAPEPTPRWRPPAAANTSLTSLALTYAILLPAVLRRLFATACRSIEIGVDVKPGSQEPKCVAYATTSARRQKRRDTWHDKIARHALPADASVAITIAAGDALAERLSPRTSATTPLHE